MKRASIVLLVAAGIFSVSGLSAQAHEATTATVWGWPQLTDILPFVAKLWPRPAAPIPRDSTAIWQNETALHDYVAAYGLLATVERLDALSSSANNCHQVAHKAGRFAFEVFGTDTFRVHTSLCHSGGMHGAAEAFFRQYGTAQLDHLLNTVCFQYETTAAIGECLHGVGHGLMAWTSYELPEALALCDRVQATGWRASCYGGVFMENVLGGLAEEVGHHTRYVSATDLRYPCTAVAEHYQSMCYYHQPSRMMFVVGNDWPRIAAACQAAPPSVRTICFQGLGKELPWQYHYEAAPIIEACRQAGSPLYTQACVYEAIKAIFADNVTLVAEAHQVCEALPVAEHVPCYQFVATWQQYVAEPSSTSVTAAAPIPTPTPVTLTTNLPPARVLIDDDHFEPKELSVRPGQTVEFVNNSTQGIWPASNIHPTHRIYPGSDIERCGTPQASRMFDACGAVAPGGTYSFQFDYPGIWRWHDHLNPERTGVVVVK